MSEPTIDEILGWVTAASALDLTDIDVSRETEIQRAVAAIIKQSEDTAYVSCSICGVAPSKLNEGASITFYCNQHDPYGSKQAAIYDDEE